MVSFGSSGSSGSQSSFSMPVQLSMWNPQQSRIANALYGYVNPNQPVESYPRLMYVPELERESQYFDLANRTAGQYDPRSQALLNTLSGKPAYQIDPSITERYFENSIRPIMMREFEDVTKPAIAEQFAGPGYWSRARADKMVDASERFSENLAATKAQLTYADEMARRQSLESAAGRQAASAGQAYEGMMSDVGVAGNYARHIKEQQTLSDLQRWFSGETIDGKRGRQYSPFIQLALQYLGLQPYTYGMMSSSSGSQSSSGLNFGLGWK
jgi:hypothetical protein